MPIFWWSLATALHLLWPHLPHEPLPEAARESWRRCFDDWQDPSWQYAVLDVPADLLGSATPGLLAGLAWSALRKPGARAQLWAGGVGLGALVVLNVLDHVAYYEFYLPETLACDQAIASGGLAWYDWLWVYGPHALIIVGTWAGLRRARGLATLPVVALWRHWPRPVLAGLLVVILLVGDAPPYVPPSPPPPAPMAQEEAPPLGCDPPRRRAVIRRPDPEVTRRVNAAWRRIERWLAVNAPNTYRSLRPPATPKRIARAEAAMGTRFPHALKASLLRHDGADSHLGSLMWFVYDPMSVKEIVADWRLNCDVATQGEPGEDRPSEEYVDPQGFWWHGSVVSFAEDSGGDSLVIDGKGRVGEFSHETGLYFTDGWPSYLHFLEELARTLESGRRWRGFTPSGSPEGDLVWD